jgi:hypothetical protein
MPTTLGLNKVDYTEIIEGYREIYRPNGNESVRILECNWNDRYGFIQDLIGYPKLDGFVAPFTLFRRLPEPHPELAYLYAVEADLLKGVGVPDISPDSNLIRFLNKVPTDPIPEPGTEEFGRARFAVIYRWLPYVLAKDGDVDSEIDRFVERRQTFSAENLGLPGNGFQFLTDYAAHNNNTLQDNVQRLLFTKELSYIWYQVPAIPEANIRNCIGKVNSMAFDTLGTVGLDGSPLGYPARTLLMIAPDIRPYSSTFGSLLYEIVYKFLYRPDTWTAAIRPGKAEFESVVFKNTGANHSAGDYGPYLQADFATLFQFT